MDFGDWQKQRMLFALSSFLLFSEGIISLSRNVLRIEEGVAEHIKYEEELKRPSIF